MKLQSFYQCFLIFLLSIFAFSLQDPTQASGQVLTDRLLKKNLQDQLTKQYPNSSIEILGGARWAQSTPLFPIQNVSLLGEDSLGRARFSVRGTTSQEYAEGTIEFSAWTTGRVAVRRIRPGDILETDSFIAKKINVAAGSAREYRGVILSQATPLRGLEAIQSIIEGQFLTSTAVRRIPDARRGDPLQIHIQSGDLVITTPGTAQELSYMNRPIKVLTLKGKRELTGLLLPGGVVEVKI